MLQEHVSAAKVFEKSAGLYWSPWLVDPPSSNTRGGVLCAPAASVKSQRRAEFVLH